MAQLVYAEGHWFLDDSRDGWRYREPGYYDVEKEIPTGAFKHLLSAEVVRQLITALDEAGWIKPRLDERLRAEDLKITHRLLDIIQGGLLHDRTTTP